MITLMIIGIVLLTLKSVSLAIRLAFGLTKGILFVVFLPLILVGMIIKGLLMLAGPVLIIALLAAFLLPLRKR